MTAQIVGFVTREEAGLPKAKSVSKNITPENGGVAVHYGGPAQDAAKPDADHSECVKTWLAWCEYHRGKNWVDVAYTGGFCNHGYAFAGRGAGVRTAAQGTNEGNQNFYGVVWIGGARQTPTEEAYDALDWWLEKLRSAGGAAKAVKPHSFFKATSCCGAPLTRRAHARDGKNVPSGPVLQRPSPTAPAPTDDRRAHVKKIQKLLKVTDDGKWGPLTDRRAKRLRAASRARAGWPQNMAASFDIRDVQEVVATKVDGIWGPKSQKALVAWVKNFQKALNVKSDGKWGPRTDGKFLLIRRRYLNRF